MSLKILRFVGLVCAALALGLTAAHVLEMPGKRQLDGAAWLAVQHTFYGGFALVGGMTEILGLLTTAGSLVLLRRRRAAFLLTLAGALGFLGMLLAYWFGNRPVNAAVAAWTPATLPADWTAYRDRWDAAHAVSAACAAVALVVLLVAVLRDTVSHGDKAER
jgi:hypothetical protein